MRSGSETFRGSQGANESNQADNPKDAQDSGDPHDADDLTHSHRTHATGSLLPNDFCSYHLNSTCPFMKKLHQSTFGSCCCGRTCVRMCIYTIQKLYIYIYIHIDIYIYIYSMCVLANMIKLRLGINSYSSVVDLGRGEIASQCLRKRKNGLLSSELVCLRFLESQVHST